MAMSYNDNGFDVISFLEDNDIDYSTSKNATSGWAEISCPYPFCSDPSKHCGVNLTSGMHHCWVCGSKGGAKKLIQLLLDISNHEAGKLLDRYTDYSAAVDNGRMQQQANKNNKCEIKMPSAFLTELPKPHRDYLIKRQFDPAQIQQQYGILASWLTGAFAYRIIIPIFINKKLVCFTSRDITGRQPDRYKHLSNMQAIIPAKQCLYNLDSADENILLVEGCLDVWRIGAGAVATLGTSVSTEQIALLRSRNFKKVFILFDSAEKDSAAPAKADRLAGKLSAFIPVVEVLYLKHGDPADIKNDDSNKLKNLLK
jgi:DNA primase